MNAIFQDCRSVLVNNFIADVTNLKLKYLVCLAAGNCFGECRNLGIQKSLDKLMIWYLPHRLHR